MHVREERGCNPNKYLTQDLQDVYLLNKPLLKV